MVMPLMMSMYATNLSSDSAATMFGANQSRMDLAGGMTGGESQGQIASVAAQDKALMFAGNNARMHYEVAQAMQQGADNLRRKNQEQKERMLANGAVFF